MILDLIGFILTPSNMIACLLVLGAAMLLPKRSRKIGGGLAVSGIALFFAAGCGPLAYLLLGQLEHQHPPCHQLEENQSISAILVLAGYGVTDAYFPPSSKVNDASLFRTVEAARLWHQTPSATILLAGPSKATFAMADLLKALKLPDKSIKRLPASHNSVGNIRSAKPYLADKSFVLVTSAGHMPRSVYICQQEQLDPIPAPTDFHTSPNPMGANWLPTPMHLRYSDLAVRERLAILYMKLRQI